MATLEEMRVPAGRFALAAAGGGRGLLLARVRRLLGITAERRPRTGRATWCLAGIITLLSAFAITVGGVQHPALAQEAVRKPSSVGERLQGRVVDENGRPVAGASIYDEADTNGDGGFAPEPVVANADGSFQVPKLRFPGQWRFLGARQGEESIGWLDIGAGHQPAAFGTNNVLIRPVVLRARRFALRGVCVDERGQAIPGATIAVTALPSESFGGFNWQRNHPEESIYRLWEALTTHSGADGTFSLPVPLEEGMQAGISAPGRQTVYPFHIVKAGVPPVTDLGRVMLRAAGGVAGRIVFQPPGGGEPQPLRNALLQAVNAAELKAAQFGFASEYESVPFSDAQGHYGIEHLPPGTYTIYLAGLNYENPSETPVTMAAAENITVRAGEMTTLDLRAVPGRRLQVQATDPATGQPVRHLPVRYIGPSRPASAGPNSGDALSDQGECALRVAPGHYRVFIPKDFGANGPELASAEVDVPADHEPDAVHLQIRTDPHLRGTVQDAQGKPISLAGSAHIALLETRPAGGRVMGGSRSSNGSFDVPLTETGIQARLVVDVAGFRAFLSPEFGLTDHPDPMMVTLEEALPLTVSGRAVDRDGKPMARANVIGRVSVADGLTYDVRLGTGIPDTELYTDADGRFETRRFRAGDRFQVNAYVKDGAASTSGWTQSDPGRSDPLHLDMVGQPPTRSPFTGPSIGPRDLAGRIVDARNQPMEGVLITVSGAYPELAPVTTDARGEFRFADFGDRHYTVLVAEKTGYGTRLVTDLTVGHKFEVQMENSTRLRGKFLKPDSTPAGPATLVLLAHRTTRRPNMDVSGYRMERRTDDQGAYDFPLEPGEYEIEVTADRENFIARHEKFVVFADQVAALPEALQTGLILRVQTVDSATGQPAPGARFHVREQKGPGFIGARPGSERQTDARGFAQWDHLFPGPVFIDVDQDQAYARFWSTDPRDHQHESAPKSAHPTRDQAADGSLYIDVLPGRSDDPVVVQTERGVIVSGRVLDPQGQPVGGVQVNVLMSNPGEENFVGLTGFPNSIVAAADGTFSNWCIPADNGGRTRLVADAGRDTLGNGQSDSFTSMPGDQHEATVRLTVGGWIEGSVVDAHGNPLAGIPVAAAATDRLDGYVNHIGPKTDAQGRFRIGPLRPTEYEVRARGADWDFDHPEPPEERRRVTVPSGATVSTGSLHFDPAGWAAPSPAVEMSTARVKVVDESGRPVAGAAITVDGLRTAADPGSYYGWRTDRDGLPAPVRTDANGIAVVHYPRTIDERMTVNALSLLAAHPDYCASRPTTYAVTDDPAKAEPVVLHPGATLRVAGRLPGSDAAVSVYPQQGEMAATPLSPDGWKDVGGNVLETHQLPAGRNYLRLMHAAPDGTLYFSEARLISAVPGGRYTLDLELKPGVRVEGRLDPAVPRPVRGGRVEIHVYATAPESDANQIGWYSWRDVAADGTFVFESLPPGGLEVTALCEGYTSTSLPESRYDSSLHVPQRFDLHTGETARVEVKMQAAAACRVTVLDEDGQSVRGARVSFAPNVMWIPGGTTIFCDSTIKMEEYVTRWRETNPYAFWLDHHHFEAFSDDRGIATVHGLPALQHTMFGVTDDRYESFPSRDHARRIGNQEGVVDLASGGTATVTVRLTKKGMRPPALEDTTATAPASSASTPPPGEPSSGFALAVHALPDAPDTFSGRVIGEDGKGLPGVLVDAWTWCPGNEATTDTDGNFQLKGLEPRRQIEVRFSKEGFTPRLVVKQPLGTMEQPLTMTSHTYFEGIVTGPDGQPAADAWVRANQGPKEADGVVISTIWTETHADAHGHYRLHAQDDRYEIQVTTREGNVARLPDADLASGQARRLDIALHAGTVLRAKFVDSESDAPVAGAKLSNWQQPGFEGVSDADGTLEIRGLPPGRFEFDVGAEGYTRWWSEQCVSEWARLQREYSPRLHWQRNFDHLDFDLQPGMPTVTITLERGVRVRGRALDPDGRTVAGATVAPALTGTGNSLTATPVSARPRARTARSRPCCPRARRPSTTWRFTTASTANGDGGPTACCRRSRPGLASKSTG